MGSSLASSLPSPSRMDSRSMGNCGSINVLGMGNPIRPLSYSKALSLTSALTRPPQVSALREREGQGRPSPRAAALDRQPRHELHGAGALVVPRVHELDRPVHEVEDRDVGRSPDLERAKARNAIDDLRRLPGRARHDLLERNAEVEELGHDV